MIHNYDNRGTGKLDNRMRDLQQRWGGWQLQLTLEVGQNAFGPALFWVVWVHDEEEGARHRLSDMTYQGPLTAVEDAIQETDRLARQAGVGALQALLRERKMKGETSE
jgi:hypothetical protein